MTLWKLFWQIQHKLNFSNVCKEIKTTKKLKKAKTGRQICKKRRDGESRIMIAEMGQGCCIVVLMCRIQVALT
jgi:hypothetical protein